MSWLSAARHAVAEGEPAALVGVAVTRGSTPRGADAKMLVTADAAEGSVGGGNLEFGAIARARELLAQPDGRRRFLQALSLGPAIGQSCGGKVSLLFERLDGRDADWLARWTALDANGARAAALSPLDAPERPKVLVDDVATLTGEKPGIIQHPEHGRCLLEWIGGERVPLFLFGAGHVGQAVIRALAPLPFDVTWIDERPGFLPETSMANLTPLLSADPPAELAKAPPGAMVLSMSHNHDRDFSICAAALARDDLAFVGMLGSDSKRANGLKRLRAQGLPQAALDRLVCPVGVPGIEGKQPAVIAAAIVAQLLLVAEQSRAETAPAESPAA
jgi:xanthine dehydrogenase accessory factor